MERVKKDVDSNSDQPQLMNDENDENSKFDFNFFDVRRIDGRKPFGTLDE